MRVATASTQVQSGGRAYNVREGDRVAMYAPLAHYDPSVFDAPDEFRVERFLAAADSAAAGVAGGATVRPEERLFPFGARCPGKHMALMQVRLSAVMLLSQLRDVHLLPGERTQLDRTHCGHEILPPTRDPLVAFTPRSRPLAFNLVD